MAYRRNFLRHVVLRLDYAPLAALHGEKQPAFSAEIHDAFPYVQPNQIMQFQFAIGAGPPVGQQSKGWQWLHTNVEGDGNRRIVGLAPDHLSLDSVGQGTYTNFAEFYATFTAIYDKFMAAYGVAEYTRIGLRFINEITIQEGEPLDWDGLLAADLVAGVKPQFARELRMTRSMHQVTALKDDITCLVNYGLNNPDFPNPIARRQFVLDLDAYVSGGIPANEAKPKIRSLYSVAKDIFEASIGAGLRQRLEAPGG
jgi:uncharacterized protein (TIGR04255 family)